MPGNAPVEKVGGTQENGPWPEAVEEITEGEAYNRPVPVEGGGTTTVKATVKHIIQLTDEQGNPTDGYAVVMEYPSPGGGA